MVSHCIIAINRDRQGFLSSPQSILRYLKMQNRPIASFFLKLAIITALLFTGDAIDILDLAKSALHSTAQTVVDSTEPVQPGSHPTRMAEGG
jgi:hypothetical protein